MNNANNIEDTKDISKVKIEYVNPLNPNEIINVKNSVSEQQTEQIIEENKIVEDTKNIEPVNSIAEDEPMETTIPKKRKGKNKILVIIILLIVLAIILSGILLVPKFINKKNKPIIQPSIQENNKINLKSIITNITNSNYYKDLTSIYTININEANNSIIFDMNNMDNTISKQIVFELNNRDLKITLNTMEDNKDSLNAIYALVDSIGQYYGHDVDEVGNYIYGLQNNYNFNIEGITTNNLVDPTTGLDNGMIEILINIDTNISTIGLENLNFTLEELNLNKDNIVNSSVNLKKGDLVLYTNNSDIYTILIGQRKELNDNTYNTINNIIELLYPEEINDFKSKFTSLSTISFDKYKITIDPVVDNIYSNYQSNYKFILIEITKQA